MFEMPERIDLAEMTSPEVKEALESGYDTAVFAVGSNEQHGPCLPVSTDTLLGDAIAYAVAEKLGNALKGPTINMGCSEHHMRFPGTISLGSETLKAVIRDYVGSLARHGFKRIVVLPSHGGNFASVGEVVDELDDVHGDVELVTFSDLPKFVGVLQETSAKFGVTPQESGAHAGEFEVSMVMRMRGDLVREEFIPEARGYMGEFDAEATTRIFEEGIGALSPLGVLGDPTKSSKEHGEAYLEELAAAIVKYVNSQ